MLKHKQLNPLDGDDDFLEDSNGFLDDEGNPSIKITMEWRTEWRIWRTIYISVLKGSSLGRMITESSHFKC